MMETYIIRFLSLLVSEDFFVYFLPELWVGDGANVSVGKRKYTDSIPMRIIGRVETAEIIDIKKIVSGLLTAFRHQQPA